MSGSHIVSKPWPLPLLVSLDKRLAVVLIEFLFQEFDLEHQRSCLTSRMNEIWQCWLLIPWSLLSSAWAASWLGYLSSNQSSLGGRGAIPASIIPVNLPWCFIFLWYCWVVVPCAMFTIGPCNPSSKRMWTTSVFPAIEVTLRWILSQCWDSLGLVSCVNSFSCSSWAVWRCFLIC